MDERLETLAAAQGWVFRQSQALPAGLTPQQTRERVRRREWCRLRQGLYVEAALVAAWDARARHRIDVAAARQSYGLQRPGPEDDPATARLLAGHTSAALLWGLPAPKLSPVRPRAPSDRTAVPTVLPGQGAVELISRDRTRRSTRHGVRIRPASVPDCDVARLGPIPLTSRGRTVADLARAHGFRAGVYAGDAALRAGARPVPRSWPRPRTALRGRAAATPSARRRSRTAGRSPSPSSSRASGSRRPG